MGAYPEELRADLQRQYHLNIDDMGRSYSCRHAAECAAHLAWPSSLSEAIDNAGSDPMRGMTASRMEALAADLGVRR